MKDTIALKGMYRLRITEGDERNPSKIIGNSGWVRNTVVNEGFDDFLCRLLFGQASSKQIANVALGTGTAPNVTDVTLPGEIMGSTKKNTFSVSVSGSKTVRVTFTFASSDSFVTAQVTLQNVGLFDGTGAAAALFAGNTYSTSACATNQNVEGTYDIQFS